MKKTTMIVVVLSVLVMGAMLFGLTQILKAPTHTETSEDTQKIEVLQQVYHKAPNFEHIAIGAYEDGFSEGDLVRDGYVPYEENYKQEDIYSLHGSAHGVSVRVHMKQMDTALAANEKMIEEFKSKASEQNYSDFQFGDTYTADNDTIVIKKVDYLNEKKQPISAFLYTDINEAEFDDKTEELLEELDVVFGFNISKSF